MLIVDLLEDTGCVFNLKLLHLCLSTCGDLHCLCVRTLFFKEWLLAIRVIKQCTRRQCCLESAGDLACTVARVVACQAVSQNILQLRNSTEGFFVDYYRWQYDVIKTF